MPGLKASAERLQFAPKATAAVLTPVLLRLPLTIGLVIDRMANDELPVEQKVAAMSPTFTAAMLQQLEATCLQRPVSLAHWLQTLDHHTLQLAANAETGTSITNAPRSWPR